MFDHRILARRIATVAAIIAVAIFVVGSGALPARAVDDDHARKADAVIKKGVAYLRTTQNEDGSWSPKAGPAVTALVVAALLDRPDIGATDPAVVKGIAYILSKAKPDGSIHNGILQNYNTTICLSALCRVNNQPGVAEMIKKAQDYLRGQQWGGQTLKDGAIVDEANPFYGGAGYGSGTGRPDLSNTQFMVQAFHDSGVDCNDPAFQHVLVFISRLQAVEGNERLAGKVAPDGGFVYALPTTRPAPGSTHAPGPGLATTRPGEKVDEGKAGLAVSTLRTYGSMSYAGLMSYVYAKLDRKDPRVIAAFDWIRKNYAVDRNPGMPEKDKEQGLYYYYLVFARALKAWGSPTITGTDGQAHDWANDLVDKLAVLQHEDGSWVNKADRWGESDPVLVTAYALNALNEVRR